MHRYGMKQLADGCERNDFCKALHPSYDGPGLAGQKLLIRMGPENAQAIKAKLTELRTVVTAAPLKRQKDPQ